MTVFLICLSISTLIWFLIKLSDVYITEINFPIKFKNPPQGKILISQVDSSIIINIQDKGYSIAALKYLSRKTPFVVDLSKLRLHRKGRLYEARINTIIWAQNIANNYGFGGEIFSIFPDTIYFLFENQVSKKIQVKPDITIDFKKQFFLYDSITVEPSEVEIRGLGNEIDTINFIRTEHLELKNLDDSVNTKLKLVNPYKSEEVTTDPEMVRVIIPVEKFTESEITIPVTEKNNNPDQRLKLFPDAVKISFLVALKDFKRINPEMFTCTVDLSKVSENANNKIPVTVGTFPKFVKITRIQPSEVDYLILK
jgi:hypothetical protein